MNMAIKNWLRSRGEASHLSDLEVTNTYLNPDYKLTIEDLTRGKTRLLKVFSLVSESEGAPSFHARMDDGGPDKTRDLELDIDIRNVSPTVARSFKAGRNGYKGHHNDRSSDRTRRIFDVEIIVPDGPVFRGQVSFNATFATSTSVAVASTVSVTADLVRAIEKPS
jgi:hypothetical protein